MARTKQTSRKSRGIARPPPHLQLATRHVHFRLDIEQDLSFVPIETDITQESDQTKELNQLLITASRDGSIQDIDDALRYGANIDAKTRDPAESLYGYADEPALVPMSNGYNMLEPKRTALMEAVRYGNIETVKHLVKAGASVNATSGDTIGIGETALLTAISFPENLPSELRDLNIDIIHETTNLEMVKILLRAGADPYIMNGSDCNWTAIRYIEEMDGDHPTVQYMKHGFTKELLEQISELSGALDAAKAVQATCDVIGVDGLPDSVVSNEIISSSSSSKKRNRQSCISSSLAALAQQQEVQQQTLKKVKVEVFNAKENASAAQVALENAEERHLCVSCMDNDVSCMYSPCKHMATCDDCDTKVEKKAMPCPLCQTQITSRVRGIFLP